MRARNIKPGFFKNEVLAECDPLARITFAGLWCLADREGRLEDRPKRIKAEILPYDDCDMDTLLEQLAQKGFILRYGDVDNSYIQILTFLDHQNPHKNEVPSVIPAPEDIEKLREDSSNYARTREMAQTTRAESLNPESLNPESLNPESLNPESAVAEENDNTTTRAETKELVDKFFSVFGHMPSPFEIQTLTGYNLPHAVVVEALHEAGRSGARNVRYVEKILQDWQARKVQCLADVERLRKEREGRVKRGRAEPDEEPGRDFSDLYL